MYTKISARRQKNIVYTAIWQRLEVIAEYSLPGNISTIIKNLLEEGVKPNTRATYNCENKYNIHTYNLNLKTYIVVAETGYSRKLSFELIEELKDLRYPTSSDLEEKTNRFNLNQDEDKIQKINNEVNEINDIVVMNIQRVLKNITKLEVIQKQSQEMETRALIFRKAGDEFFSLARCQNIKWKIICSCCGIMLAVLLGFAFYSSVT
jgi:Synaptobrevin/Regulated-SNARE-like domain